MAEQKISTYLIGFLMVSLFIVGGGYLVGHINNQYGISADTSYQNTYNIIDNITDEAESLTGYTNSSAGDSNPISTVINAFTVPFTAVYNSMTFIAGIIGDTIDNLPFLSGYGTLVVRVLQAAITILISLLIYNLIFRVGRAG